jgi:hypothetical protein
VIVDAIFEVSGGIGAAESSLDVTVRGGGLAEQRLRVATGCRCGC